MRERVLGLLDAVPSGFDVEAIRERYPLRHEDSMATVLYHEASRYNGLLEVVRRSLEELLAALRGEIVMSESLEAVGGAVFAGQVPSLWADAGYLSLKPLGPWMVDLGARIGFLQEWYERGPPSVFWLSGFFYPQAFLTGVLQNYARKYQVPIDSIRFRATVLDTMRGETLPPPEDGAYIHGLFMEGAKWDSEAGMLVEADDKVLISQVPALWLEPELVESDGGEEEDVGGAEGRVDAEGRRLYECPIYKTLARYGQVSTSGQSNNFVLSVWLPCLGDAEYWVKRSVAMFCEMRA